MIQKILKNWLTLVLIVFSLIPALWFLGRGGVLIDGVDTNFPLHPLTWFNRRLFVWNDVANAGINFASSTAGLFFHLVQVIPYGLGLNLQLVQIVSLVFWFGLVVGASYIFSKTIFPGSKLSQLVFVSLYTFNIYLFNTWENIKVANLAVVVSIPLLLAIFIAKKNEKISLPGFLMSTALVGVLSSGAGINPAYFLVIVGVLVIWSIINGGRKILLLMLSVLLLVNSFWIVSTGKYLFFSQRKIVQLDDIGFTNWLDSLSENTSLVNVFRLQGAWDWYSNDDSGAPLYIPYATNFLRRLPFVIFSFVLTAIALAGFLVKGSKNSRLKVSFGALLVMGIFLGSGSHPPTGSVYEFLVKYLPFFSFFRSPWYVFTPFVTLAISGLSAMIFTEKKKIYYLLAFILVFGNLLYNYPLITGKIFRPAKSDGFFINFPDYVFETKDWLKNQEGSGRIIGYPGDEIERFNWGYRGVESILNLFSFRETLFAGLNATDSPVSKVVNAYYINLRQGKIEMAESLSGKLNITTIFSKNDQDSLWGSLPEFVKDSGSTSFGSWTFYDLPQNKVLPKIYSPDKFFWGYPPETLEKVVDFLPGTHSLADPRDSVANKITDANKLFGKIILAENSQTIDYERFQKSASKQQQAFDVRDLSRVNYVVDVPETGQFTPLFENFLLNEFGISWENGIDVVVDGVESKWTIKDSGDVLVFEPVLLSQGSHTISINLDNKNLVPGNDKVLGLTNRDDEEKYVSVILDPFDSSHPYLIGFDYRNIYGRKSVFKVEQKNSRVNFKFQSEGPPFSPEWEHFSFYFDPIATDDSYLEIKRSILPIIDDPLGTKIEYGNLSVYRVFTNRMAFLSEPEISLNPPKEILFDKISPVSYKGEVRGQSGSHILVFSENYSEDWEIVLKNVGGSVVNFKPLHFSANLYANAWFIEDLGGDYDFEIYYKPQWVHDVFLLISGLTLLGILGYYLKSKIKI